MGLVWKEVYGVIKYAMLIFIYNTDTHIGKKFYQENSTKIKIAMVILISHCFCDKYGLLILSKITLGSGMVV